MLQYSSTSPPRWKKISIKPHIILLVAVCSCLLLFSSAAYATAGWYDSGYLYRKAITINHTKVQASSIAYVQSSKTVTSGSNSNTVTLNGVGAGDLLVLVISCTDGTSGTDTVSDGTNTWTQIGTKLGPSTDAAADWNDMFYAQNVAAGNTTVTVTTPGGGTGQQVSLALSEYSGVATTNALDQTAGVYNTSGSGSTADSGSTAATDTANELLVCGLDDDGGSSSATVNAGTNYTLRQSNTSGSSKEVMGLEDRIVSSTGTYNGTFSVDSGVQWGARIATFRAAQLSNFPVLISLTDANLADKNHSGYVQNASGYDIVFTDSSGTTRLNHEIEKYDGTTGTIAMWVCVPTLSASSDTVIYLYFDNSSISTNPSTPSTWDSNYVGVWHLKETSGQHLDSTSNSINSTTVNVTTQGGTLSGTLAGADQFVKASSNYVAFANNTKLMPAAGTIECWTNLTGLPSGSNDYNMLFQNNTSGWGYYLDVDSSNHKASINIENTSGTSYSGEQKY